MPASSDNAAAASTAVATGGNITETPTSWVMPVVIGIVVIVLAGVFLLARKKGK